MTATDRINRVLGAMRLALALVSLSIAVLAVIVVAWVVVTKPAIPKFRMVAEHGSVLSIVVDEQVAADDAALLQIADSLVPRFRLPMLELHVWTDARMVPYDIVDMTPAQLAARRALVRIDVNRDVRQVAGRVK